MTIGVKIFLIVIFSYILSIPITSILTDNICNKILNQLSKDDYKLVPKRDEIDIYKFDIEYFKQIYCSIPIYNILFTIKNYSHFDELKDIFEKKLLKEKVIEEKETNKFKEELLQSKNKEKVISFDETSKNTSSNLYGDKQSVMDSHELISKLIKTDKEQVISFDEPIKENASFNYDIKQLPKNIKIKKLKL